MRRELGLILLWVSVCAKAAVPSSTLAQTPPAVSCQALQPALLTAVSSRLAVVKFPLLLQSTQAALEQAPTWASTQAHRVISDYPLLINRLQASLAMGDALLSQARTLQATSCQLHPLAGAHTTYVDNFTHAVHDLEMLKNNFADIFKASKQAQQDFSLTPFDYFQASKGADQLHRAQYLLNKAEQSQSVLLGLIKSAPAVCTEKLSSEEHALSAAIVSAHTALLPVLKQQQDLLSMKQNNDGKAMLAQVSAKFSDQSSIAQQQIAQILSALQASSACLDLNTVSFAKSSDLSTLSTDDTRELDRIYAGYITFNTQRLSQFTSMLALLKEIQAQSDALKNERALLNDYQVTALQVQLKQMDALLLKTELYKKHITLLFQNLQNAMIDTCGIKNKMKTNMDLDYRYFFHRVDQLNQASQNNQIVLKEEYNTALSLHAALQNMVFVKNQQSNVGKNVSQWLVDFSQHLSEQQQKIALFRSLVLNSLVSADNADYYYQQLSQAKPAAALLAYQQKLLQKAKLVENNYQKNIHQQENNYAEFSNDIQNADQDLQNFRAELNHLMSDKTSVLAHLLKDTKLVQKNLKAINVLYQKTQSSQYKMNNCKADMKNQLSFINNYNTLILNLNLCHLNQVFSELKNLPNISHKTMLAAHVLKEEDTYHAFQEGDELRAKKNYHAAMLAYQSARDITTLAACKRKADLEVIDLKQLLNLDVGVNRVQYDYDRCDLESAHLALSAVKDVPQTLLSQLYFEEHTQDLMRQAALEVSHHDLMAAKELLLAARAYTQNSGCQINIDEELVSLTKIPAVVSKNNE